MQLGSLFAGIGGFDLGFEQAGFKTIWQVEKEPNCLKLLASKFPHAARHDDVTTFNPDHYECPDVLTYGFPCQDLSVAGQRDGLAGNRSSLFYEATRIIARLVPRGLQFAVAENVPGLFSSDGGRDFARVLGTLGQCGALDIGWATLDAQWFGLAQRRKRVFIVADFRAQRAAQILSLLESLCWHPPPSRETGQRVAPTIEGRAGRSGANNFATSGGLVEPCANPLGGHHGRNDLDHDTFVAATLTKQYASHHGRTAGNNGGVAEKHLLPDVAWALQERDSKGADSKGADSKGADSSTKDGHLIPVQIAIPIQEIGKRQSGTPMNGVGHGQSGDPMYTLQSGAQHGVCVGAFKPNQGAASRSIGYSEELSPTLEAAEGGNNKPAALVATGVRRLTPTECERLQGFPDGWLDGLGFSDSTKYRMFGNAVPPPVAKWIANRLKLILP